MLFNRKKKMINRQQEEYQSCKSVWYFCVEYHEDFANTSSFMSRFVFVFDTVFTQETGCIYIEMPGHSVSRQVSSNAFHKL